MTARSLLMAAAGNSTAVTWRQWTISNSDWLDCAYGAGLFVAVSNHAGYSTSPDGQTWTQRSMSPGSAESIAYGGTGTFVIMGATTNNYVATSTDGITWSQGTIDWSQPLYINTKMCCGNGVWVVVMNGSSSAARSLGGGSWSQVDTGHTDCGYCIAWGNNMFVSLGSTSGGFGCVSSPTGVTWTPRTMPGTNVTYTTVAFGAGRFVAMTSGGNAGATSVDGITWTSLATPPAGCTVLEYGNGVFVGLKSLSATSWTSADGLTWISSPITSASSWQTLAWGGGSFAALTNGTVCATSP